MYFVLFHQPFRICISYKNCKENRKLLVLTGIIVKEYYLLNLKYSAKNIVRIAVVKIR
jgi:hypothetical protein